MTTTQRGAIMEDFLTGGPLESVDVVDCHSHMGPALYMQVTDPHADGLVRVLDSLGVATVCVAHTIGMVSDWKLGNDLLIEAVAKYPERIFGYAVYNPRYPDQMSEEMERCAAAGVHGLKIHPDFHRTPVGSPLYDMVFERASAEGRAILCHYGAGRGQNSGSNLYGEAVKRFPGMVCVMAHSLPNIAAVDTAVELFGSNEDVAFCLANAFQPGVIEYGCRRLGAERLVYGSDGCWSAMSTRLGLVCCADVAEGDKVKILGGNMRGIIKRCS